MFVKGYDPKRNYKGKPPGPNKNAVKVINIQEFTTEVLQRTQGSLLEVLEAVFEKARAGDKYFISLIVTHLSKYYLHLPKIETSIEHTNAANEELAKLMSNASREQIQEVKYKIAEVIQNAFNKQEGADEQDEIVSRETLESDQGEREE